MPRLMLLVSSAAAGYFAEDALAAHERFTAAGFDVTVVTPDGEPPTIDPMSLEPVFHYAEEDADFLASVVRSFASDPEDVRVTLRQLSELDLIAARRIYEVLRGSGWTEPEARREISQAARAAWAGGRNLVDVLGADGRFTAAIPAEAMRRLAEGLRRDSAREAAATAERLESIPGFQKPVCLGDLGDDQLEGFDGVFVPGGRGPLADLASNPDAGRLLRRLQAAGRVVATISQGAAALLSSGGRPDGAWLFDGYRMAALTNEEVAQAEAGGAAPPWTVEDGLKNAGAVFAAAASAWSPHVVVDRNLITAQNPMSTGAAVDVVLKHLGAFEDVAVAATGPVRGREERVADPAGLARLVFDRLDRHDVDGALTLVDPAAVVEFLPVRLAGRANREGRAFLERLVAAFPDLVVRAGTVFAGAGDTVVAELVLEGTQAADFYGILNQRKHMDLRQAWLLDVGDGQVRRLRAYWCQNQLYRRLGVRRLDTVARTAGPDHPPRPALMDTHGRAEAVVQEFFAAHHDHDVERMTGCCSGGAGFSYIPVEWWGRQRVVRGEGKVGTVGKALWTGLFEAFPDLTNEVTSVVADDQGNVAAEVIIGGTQAGEWGTIGNRGRRFCLPHLFVFRVGYGGLIERVAAYWDDARLREQLGTVDVD